MLDPQMHAHLTNALAAADTTVILASHDGQGGMVLHTRGARARDLVDVARSLLQHAADALQAGEDLDPIPELSNLLSAVEDAIEALPDPHAEGA